MNRQDRRTASRRRILSAAAKLVARDGVEALSLREVARKSGYSPAGLYAYFDGRDGILEALAEQDAQALAATLRQAPSQEHPLIALGIAWLQFASAHPGRLRLALTHPSDTVQAVFIEQVEECVLSGEIMPGPGFDVEEIAATLQALAHGAASMGQSPALLREGMRCLLVGLRD